MKVELDEQNLTANWCGVEKQSEDENEGDDDGDADYTDHRVPATPRRKRQVRSAVWQYFNYDEDRRPSCKICGWKLTAGSSGSTSNMRHHLQSQHQILCPLSKVGVYLCSRLTLTRRLHQCVQMYDFYILHSNSGLVKSLKTILALSERPRLLHWDWQLHRLRLLIYYYVILMYFFFSLCSLPVLL